MSLQGKEAQLISLHRDYGELLRQLATFVGHHQAAKSDEDNHLVVLVNSDVVNLEYRLFNHVVKCQIVPVFDVDEWNETAGAIVIKFYTLHLDEVLPIMELMVRYGGESFIDGEKTNFSVWEKNGSYHYQRFRICLSYSLIRKLGDVVHHSPSLPEAMR